MDELTLWYRSRRLKTPGRSWNALAPQATLNSMCVKEPPMVAAISTVISNVTFIRLAYRVFFLQGFDGMKHSANREVYKKLESFIRRHLPASVAEHGSEL